MPLSDIANVSISVSARGPTQQGFGEPLIAAIASWQTTLVAEYSALSDLTAAGCPVTDPVYLCAQVLLSQQPTVPFFKVGRRANKTAPVVKLTLHSTSTSDMYNFSLSTPGGVLHPIAYQSTGVPTTDAASINTLITAFALTGVTTTNATGTLTMTCTAGSFVNVVFPAAGPCQLGALVTYQDTTADPGLAADLAAINLYDTNWYGLLLDWNSPAEAALASVFAEANKKLYGSTVSDSACTDPASTTDVMYLAKTAAYTHTYHVFSGTQNMSYSAAGLMAVNFPSNPGSENWAFKTIASVPADNLNTNAIHAVEAKNGNVYTPVAGLNLTQFGMVSFGEGVDIPRLVDWLTNQIQVQLLFLLANSNKVPFTDAGIDAVRGVIGGVLQAGVLVGGLSANPAPYVSAPLAASVNAINRAARNLPNVTFSAKLAGAINSITISGVVTS